MYLIRGKLKRDCTKDTERQQQSKLKIQILRKGPRVYNEIQNTYLDLNFLNETDLEIN